MPVNVETASNRLAASVQVLHDLVKGVSDAQARWKPGPERWSILEVINHLYDEEREDFRYRFRHLLERPDEPVPPIDPPRWAIERRYNERQLGPSLEGFLAERRASLAWLATLEAPNLEIASPTGRTTGELLAAWVVHDLLHVRQLTKLHYDYWAREVQPLRLEYAGEWR